VLTLSRQVDEGQPLVDGTMHLWSGVLRKQFDMDNLHLTARTADTGHVQIVTAVQQLGAQVSVLSSTVSAMQRHLSSAASAVSVGRCTLTTSDPR
jgi:hypothetical protein